MRLRVTRMRARTPARVPGARATTMTPLGQFVPLLWWPGWRGALTPGFVAMLAGVAAASAVSLAWTLGPWPVVPGAAWAFGFGLLMVSLTERLHRTMEAHLDALAPWLATLPIAGGWRWRARLVVAAPMLAAGAVLVALVLAARPWRAWPLAAFVVTLLATPLALASVRSSNREAHVGLWAMATALLTAFGSELWN